MKGKRTVLAVLALCGIAVGLLAAPFIVIFCGPGLDVWRSNHERAQLLFRTDHRALLAACRQVMTNRHAFARDIDWHGPQDPAESLIDPKDPKIPRPIASLHPRDVFAKDSEVHLELHGGFDHYGVIALSEQAAHDAATNRFSGPIELIPGLWYYDEGLAQDHDRWIKKLRQMRPHDAPTPTW
jgi:hypothetical protein